MSSCRIQAVPFIEKMVQDFNRPPLTFPTIDISMTYSFPLLFGLTLAFFSGDALAYLDPGTGSMLISVLVGIFSSAYFVLRKIPGFIRRGLFRKSGVQDILTHNSIAIYSESKSYLPTFKPLLDEFSKRNIGVLYLTSAADDPLLGANYAPCIRGKYIGTGNKAYTFLNFLEADVFVLTTPGVGVLQINKSKGVKRYVHVLHSASDIHLYKYFAFDCYDEVILNGGFQRASLEYLEQYRGSGRKELPIIGIPYFDEFMGRLSKDKDYLNRVEDNTILLAPTWGKNGMLSRFGSKIPLALARKGFRIIFRPHPQSYISDKRIMEKVRKDLDGFDNVEWDTNPDGFESMKRVRVLVSDFSSIVYDFAFCFLRPVVTISYEPVFDGFDGFDLPNPIWDLKLYEMIGKRVHVDDLDNIATAVSDLIHDREISNVIKRVRDENIKNFGHAAPLIVDEIVRGASK